MIQNSNFPKLCLLVLAVFMSFAVAEEQKPNSINSLLRVSEAFREAIRTAKPSVVAVKTLLNPPSEGEPQFEFRKPKDKALQPKGLGTGLIFDLKGHIITSQHLIRDAISVEVEFLSGKVKPAQLLYQDQATDLALLYVEPEPHLIPAQFADSETIEVGDWVLAIGHSKGFPYTATHGIVSAKGRRGLRGGPGAVEDFIQTDAAINHGNSGGPLLNLKGEVVGLNSMISSRSGGSEGLGFAIPSNMVKAVVDQLLRTGKVHHGFLGIIPREITARLARHLSLKSREGILIEDVMPGSPADLAGLKAMDSIVGLNGQPVKNAQRFADQITVLGPEAKVDLTIIREQKEVVIEVELGFRGRPEERRALIHGLTVRTASEEERHTYRQSGGVVIEAVEENSLADQAGLKKGDFISTVDRQVLKGAVDFIEKVRQSMKSGDHPGEVMLYVFQQSRGSFVFLIEKKKAQ